MKLMSRMGRMALVVSLAAGASMGGVLTAWVPTAGAAVNGYCGDVVSGTLHGGQSLREGGLESPHLHIYAEVSNKTLSSSVAVDLRNVGTYRTPSSLPSPRPL